VDFSMGLPALELCSGDRVSIAAPLRKWEAVAQPGSAG
jgi:hypothetical protein